MSKIAVTITAYALVPADEYDERVAWCVIRRTVTEEEVSEDEYQYEPEPCA